MSSSSRAALEALNALFVPAPAYYEAPAEVPPAPDTLDDSIRAEEGQFAEVALFRWYRGQDLSGVERFFKFQRGLPLTQWRELLVRQRMASVAGPFRTLVQAQQAAR